MANIISRLSVSKEEITRLVKDFANEHFSEANIRSWYKNQGMPPEVLKDFYATQLGKYCLFEELGGIQTDMQTQAYIIEQLHREAGALLPILSNSFSLLFLRTLGDQKDFDLVKGMLEETGSTGFSEAVSEPQAGSDVFAIKTTAKTADGKIYLNGTKNFVSNGEFSPYILVLAKDEDASRHNKSMTFWLIPRNLRGVYISPLESIGQMMTPLAVMHFDNVELDERYALCARGDATRAIMPCFDMGRTLICAASLGLAEAAMDDAIQIGSKRESFGATVTSLPQIQEKLTDMEVNLRSMRALTYEAAEKHDKAALTGFTNHEDNMNFKLSATLAKRMVPKTATQVASEAMQILGGMGYTQLSRAGRIWNDCRGNQFAQGTDEIMVKVAAKRIVADYLNGKL